MKFFFDTETTGRANFRLPADHPSQPRLVSIAMVLTDGECKELASANLIIRPNGFTIPEEATAVHGITTEQAHAVGVSLFSALGLFRSLATAAHSLHAYNFKFDDLVVCGELRREKIVTEFMSRPAFCEMLKMTPICKLPANYRGGDFKWPSLAEAHQFAFGCGFDGAHDAMADVRALIRIYAWREAQEGKCKR